MNVFDKVINCEKAMIDYLDTIAERTPLETTYDWTNIVWSNPNFRRAHLDSVDARTTKGLYMMHLCIFPHDHNSSPIFGFDIICGKTKVTGAFHDFSRSEEDNHAIMIHFKEKVAGYDWIKTRTLPEWALQIFSPSMVAATNVNTEVELDSVIELAMDNLKYFVSAIGEYNHTTSNQIIHHNRYCHYQKQNPHTPKVMSALGLDDAEVENFIHNELFPEV